MKKVLALTACLSSFILGDPAHAAAQLKVGTGTGVAILDYGDHTGSADVFLDIGIEAYFNRFTKLGISAVVPYEPDDSTQQANNNDTQIIDKPGLNLATQLNLQQQLIETNSYRLYGTLGLSYIAYRQQNCYTTYRIENGGGWSYDVCSNDNQFSGGVNFGIAVEPYREQSLRFEYLHTTAENNLRLHIIRGGTSF